MTFDAVRRDGTVFPIEATVSSYRTDGGNAFVGIFRDITERRHMQAQLMQADRLATVGAIAAGVAHEINNPLSYVTANIEYVAQQIAELSAALRQVSAAPGVVPSPGPARLGMLEVDRRLGELAQAVAEAREGADRVRKIVGDLKTFSRPEQDKKGPVSIERVLESVLAMAWNEIRHRARVVKEYTPVPLVVANEARLAQVFLNLVINAAQAIPEGRAEANIIRLRTWSDGDRVHVEVRDTGSGIPPDTVARIFDPFFTTKAVGQGTGLGLSIAQTIVSSLGGEIAVESELGKGTAFRVSVPVGEPPAVADAPKAAMEPSPGPRGRVLIIDDEPLVGSMLKRILSADHEVICVTDGREALKVVAAGERFDVILCDLMMPGVTGMDVYAEMARRFADQVERMIFVTGGAFTPEARQFLDRVPNPQIEKPLQVNTVRAVVRQFVR